MALKKVEKISQIRKKIMFNMIFLLLLSGLSTAFIIQIVFFDNISFEPLPNNVQSPVVLIDAVIAATTLFFIVVGAFLVCRISSRLNIMMREAERLTKHKERERIAFDLHDSYAGDLADVIKRLELCEKLFNIDPSKSFAELNILKDNVKGILNKTRHSIKELKLCEDSEFDLLESLNNYIKDFQQYENVDVKLRISAAIDSNIPIDKSKQIFYIITEALTNIKKHAQARNARVCLEYNHVENMLTINIEDDGKGFDVKATELFGEGCGKLGLMSMRQRVVSLGGIVSIDSKPDKGTLVSVKIPVKREKICRI